MLAVVVLPPRLGRRLVTWWFEPAARPMWLVRLAEWRRPTPAIWWSVPLISIL
jgi:hypothetical protein